MRIGTPVGTGVGWLAIEAARSWPALRVVGIDSWEPALILARKNLAQSGVVERVEVVAAAHMRVADEDLRHRRPSAGALDHLGAQIAASRHVDLDELRALAAKQLDLARQSIEPRIGASIYSLSQQAIQNQPGSDNVPLNQVLLQAPEVAQDSFGQYHVRGEHNGLQYRLDGVILPEGISVFGQSLDPRLIDSVTLVTGALPAEYGLRTAGIIDIKTKSAGLEPGGSVSLYGGSHGTFQPSIDYAGGSGGLQYFISADALTSDAPSATTPAISEDARVTAMYPEQLAGSATIHMRDGGVLDAFVPVPRGEPQNTLSPQDLRVKFTSLVEPYLSDEQQDGLFQTIMGLDSGAQVSDLFRWATPAKTSGGSTRALGPA